MKKLLTSMIILVTSVMLLGAVPINHKFTHNEIESLKMGMKSDNEGLKKSSMTMVMKYDIKEAMKVLEDELSKLNEIYITIDGESKKLDGLHIKIGEEEIKVDLTEFKAKLLELEKVLIKLDESKVEMELKLSKLEKISDLDEVIEKKLKEKLGNKLEKLSKHKKAE